MIDLVKVFTDNYKLIYRIIYSYTGNVEDTKDLMQDVFIRAYKAPWAKIKTDELLPWLIVIAKNTSKTFMKKKKGAAVLYESSIDISYESDFLEFTIYDVLNEMIIIAPKDLRNPLKAHLMDDIPLKRVAKDQNLPYSRLRYWKSQMVKTIKPLIKV